MSNIVSVPGHLETIQAAVDSIGPNQTIVIRLTAPGHKERRVQVNDGRDVTIESAGTERTIWSGDDRGVWGLLEIRSAGTVHLRRMVMTTNRTNRAIWSENANLTLEDCDVTNCGRESAAFVGGFGGAIESRRTNARFKNCNFTNNSMSDNGACVDCYGGALYFNSECIVTIEACRIESNEVYGSSIAGRFALGGGIWCEDSHMVVKETAIRKNDARADFGRGGGVALKNVRGVEFVKSEITFNKALGRNTTRHGRDAGIFLERGLEEPVTFNDCLIADNHTEDGEDPFVIR